MTAELSGCVIVTGAPGAGKSTVTELADAKSLAVVTGRSGHCDDDR